MSYRFKGRLNPTILRKLPRNLVVFDGHCLMCQARVQYVLERNFSYFSLLNLTLDVDKVKLRENKVLFCSFDSIEWRELRRHFPDVTKDVEGIILFEKVPSRTADFLSRVRRMKKRSKSLSKSNEALSFPVASSSHWRSFTDVEDELDILISTKHTAVCRVGMKLDRWLPSVVARCMLYAMPRWIGDRWYDRVLRRRTLWGTSEEDAVRYPARVLGLKERTWRLRDM
ncbi:hypothetical protein, conserved [Trypanosoma brucei gambiense DAL972]|uniref:Uncharacterized protein n=1 Tax=Trypanosoma brucei gambiense (strain MHOM/CI/86/DAL972) TaxID=679716 RepID=D0A146_TRYB9|nr:LOW QUALITY PROTEIN: hypothetical protein, conserved [Trypanosoma brucei gambiense DAL972]CBH14988.1 hypothetical protein, conserved [Trypanosoma brucei gambiense DAL972]|eukprot:XP_011777254.1 LOW QUALITY PROTEIN: hypothetical protein, conserved [Trypanosoma brucei gambiense DAL972]